jgi:hypothetical protein
MPSNPYAVKRTPTKSHARWAMWSKKGRAAAAGYLAPQVEEEDEHIVRLGGGGDEEGGDEEVVRPAEPAVAMADPLVPADATAATAAAAAMGAREERSQKLLRSGGGGGGGALTEEEEELEEELELEGEPQPEQLQGETLPARLKGEKQHTSANVGLIPLDGQPLVLSNSFIPNFDGEYQHVGLANGKPHWQSKSGMHLFWGPRQMWHLRIRFTPDAPMCSAFCTDEQLLYGSNDFQWSKGTWWVASPLQIAAGPTEPACDPRSGTTNVDMAAGAGSVAGVQLHEAVRISRCLHPLFDGIYRLVGQANGRPHWAHETSAKMLPAGLHLYRGPPEQDLWLLRSKFGPDEKACSAYCSCSDIPTGRNLWHWMQGGEWVEKELSMQIVDSTQGQETQSGGGSFESSSGAGCQAAEASSLSSWTLSEECEPPSQPGPWDVRAAEVARAAREAGAAAARRNSLGGGGVGGGGGLPSSALSPSSAQRVGGGEIVEQVAEFLRSRCMEDHHVLAAFEDRACEAFDTPVEDGFTFEQAALHREFCAMFEGFTNEFLQARGVSEADFGEAMSEAISQREGKISEGDTDGGGSVEDIMSVLDEVADITKWADSMRHMRSLLKLDWSEVALYD